MNSSKQINNIATTAAPALQTNTTSNTKVVYSKAAMQMTTNT